MLKGRHLCIDLEDDDLSIYTNWESSETILILENVEIDQFLIFDDWLYDNHIYMIRMKEKYSPESPVKEYMLNESQLAQFILEFQ